LETLGLISQRLLAERKPIISAKDAGKLSRSEKRILGEQRNL
jgi:hypothetical protein